MSKLKTPEDYEKNRIRCKERYERLKAKRVTRPYVRRDFPSEEARVAFKRDYDANRYKNRNVLAETQAGIYKMFDDLQNSVTRNIDEYV